MVFHPDNQINPYYVAQDILSRRDHSEAELRKKMQRKGFSVSEINTVIIRLKAKQLINDAEFAHRYVQYTLANKAVGPKWLSSKLRAKQVSSVHINAALAAVFSENGELKYARAAAAAWKRSHSQHSDDRQRLVRFLAARGFSSDVIYQATASDEISL